MDTKDMAISLFGYDSFKKGLKINSSDINFYDCIKRNSKDQVFIFQVNSQSRYYYYDVSFIANNKIVSFFCECEQFKKFHTCKHVAACFLNYRCVILKNSLSNIDESNNILMKFYNNNFSNKIKEALKVYVELIFDSGKTFFKIYIGLNKMYVINKESKFNDFMEAYYDNEEYQFGVNFTYNPSLHYIDSKCLDILKFLHGYTKNYYSYFNPFELNDRELNSLLDKLDETDFKIQGHGFFKKVNRFLPSKFSLKIADDNYCLLINDFNKYHFLDNNFKYCVYGDSFYIIPQFYSNLFLEMNNNELKSLIIDKEHLDIFKDGLLQNIKNDILIDDEINDILLAYDPSVDLFFDISKDMISCTIKFNYNENVVEYYDKCSKVVRDYDFEKGVIKDIENLGFLFSNNSIFLSDVDLIGDFLSNGINSLNGKYNVFTSKNFNNINVIKKSNIKSNFSIGSDGILSYSFSIDDIDLSELKDILLALRKNKKYYKFKDGNYLDLINNDLKDFNSLIGDLNLSINDLDNEVVIPKYQALYIDSLKKNKYKFISTDISFDLFIDNFNKFRNINIDFGSDSKVLRDYQKDGVKWLYTLYKCDLGGILADEMGLGKSLQTICFIKQLIKNKSDCKIIIVCPTSLVYNWQKEFDKFSSNIKYITVADNKKKRLEIINNFDSYNVFITSYGLIRNDNDEYENKFFDVCIIDEAQAIKNYQSGMTQEIKKIKAHTKIALTGTPLENSVLELWSIFDFIMPGYLNSIYKFRQSYGISDVDDDSLRKLDNLNYQISPFILRRKKADVISELPDKIEKDIYLDFGDEQKRLYLSLLDESKQEFEEMMGNSLNNNVRLKVLQLLMKLRQVCIDPSILFENYNGCAIKMQKILDIVQNCIREGHKILIFSSFKTVIDNVKVMFDANDISSYIISGNVKSKERMHLVEKFNSDDTNCFLITLKSGGTGLNLTGADVVIHLDIWWNPQVENQATDRAHRIGQKNNVEVIRLITKGTIEEKIIELQNKKKVLVDNLINGKDSANFLSSLNENDIRDLLSYSAN